MSTQRWLISGASGQLGGHVLAQLAAETSAPEIMALAGSGPVVDAGVAVQRVDLGDTAALRGCARSFRPTHIVHLGALTAVADAHARPRAAERVNVGATRVLAETAAELRARLVFTSTDMVFDGAAAPYRESDPPTPVSHYGRTKAAAEQALATVERALTVRVPLMYGFSRTPRETTFARQIAALRNNDPLRLFTDEFRTPIWLADAAAAIIALARSDLTGVIHVAGRERLSRFEMVERFAGVLGIAEPNLVATSRLSIASSEPRPADLSLDGTRLVELFPSLAPGPIRAAVFAGE